MRRHRVFQTLVRSAALLAALVATSAHALECGKFIFPFCGNERSKPSQFAGGFAPMTGYGGFGGGDCRTQITHVPVVFVHGNKDSAIGWSSPALPHTDGQPTGLSVYDEFKKQGYNDCELFGVTYLTHRERQNDSGNFHQPKKYRTLWKFIQAVKDYTGSAQVDIVAHSLGVSMTLATLDYYADQGKGPDKDAWSSVRRIVNIAGALHGLNSCTTPFGSVFPTCKPEHTGTKTAFYEFGFYPDLPLPGQRNRWTAVTGDHAMRLAPEHHPDVAFYTIYAGAQDDIHCAWPVPVDCTHGPLFNAAANVRAQLDIGAEPGSPRPAWTAPFVDDFTFIFRHDLGGIGHFGARNYAGPIISQMLATDCHGKTCASGYTGKVDATP